MGVHRAGEVPVGCLGWGSAAAARDPHVGVLAPRLLGAVSPEHARAARRKCGEQRRPQAGRGQEPRLCDAGGGRAGQATPGGADAPHSEHTHSYKVVVVNELEVNVEA